jgi:hypothetical protein
LFGQSYGTGSINKEDYVQSGVRCSFSDIFGVIAVEKKARLVSRASLFSLISAIGGAVRRMVWEMGLVPEQAY